MKINGFISTVILIGLLLIATLGGTTHAQDEEDWMPDPNLRQTVREKLEFPDGIPMLPEDMAALSHLLIIEHNIESLRGLEYAVNLEFVHIGRGEVSDLTPLAGLENLSVLKLFRNPISDISPLAGLIGLRELHLGNSLISDLTPLANLQNLRVLRLQGNQISDIFPLAGLTELRELILQGNAISDFTPLVSLTNLQTLHIYPNPIPLGNQFIGIDTSHLQAAEEYFICEKPRPSYTAPVAERLNNRDYPSVFLTHKRANYEEEPDPFNQLVHYDFSFMFEPFYPLVYPHTSNSPFGGMIRTGSHETIARLSHVHREAIRENPNMIFIVEIAYFDGRFFNIPEDSPYWFRNQDGSIAHRGNQYLEPLLNFTHPDVIEMIIQHAVAVAKCGLYDGIWLDRWQELEGDFHGELRHLVPKEDELNARLQILQGIRTNVPEDFLIMVNSRQELPHSAPYINGVFIEAHEPNPTYTHKALYHFEKAIKWYESNLREPTFTLLWGEVYHKPPITQQTVRQFTTLSLTHSDGYVNVSSGAPDISTYWYDFWEAPLGRPIGGDETKAQLYEDREGLFIREFTNGWAVYNRSGTAQEIEFSEEVSGWDSGVEHQRLHTLPDLDGEIYLKTVVQVAPGEYPPLYWIDAKTDTLQHLVDTEVKNLVSDTQNATSLTVDTANEKLYWTEKTSNRTGKIQRANLDGTNIQLVKDLTSAPLDIALDTAGGKLYLSNAWGKIQRMNLDGSNFQPNFITDLMAPQNLVLDSVDGKLYWTEQTGKATGKVQRANLDGSNVQLVKELTSAPRGMTLDAVNKKLYLTNGWGKLQRMNLNGSNFESNLITGLASAGRVAVDVLSGKVYWTEKGKLRRADLNGENIQDVITGLGELVDMSLGIDSVGEMGVAAAPAITSVVEQTQLLANYPNPFNPETWIPYQLVNPSDVRITIYDTRGTVIRHLDLGHQPQGYYTSQSRAAYWDGRNTVGERVASGVYFYQLQADNVSLLRKMIIVK